jgi:transposase
MVDVNDDAKGGFRRVELLTGPGRRRRWSAEEKSRIVAETLEPGAAVSEVARRWHVCPQQVFGWRRAARVPAQAAAPTTLAFVPVVTEAAPTAETSSAAAPTASSAPVEVRIAGALLRVRPGTDEVLLTTVLRALRCSASET